MTRLLTTLLLILLWASPAYAQESKSRIAELTQQAAQNVLTIRNPDWDWPLDKPPPKIVCNQDGCWVPWPVTIPWDGCDPTTDGCPLPMPFPYHLTDPSRKDSGTTAPEQAWKAVIKKVGEVICDGVPRPCEPPPE